MCVPHVVKEAEKGRTVSSENIEEVKEERILNVTNVLCPCLLEGGTVYDPSFACLGEISG